MNFSHALFLLVLSTIMAKLAVYANGIEHELLTLHSQEEEIPDAAPGPVTSPPKADAANIDDQVKKRFIPVELFTGAKWDGKHELKMEQVTNSTCASYNGRQCDDFHITGPFKTTENNTQIAWAGNEIPYYRRTFTLPRRGEVVSFFTINNSKDGLVRIYDKRQQWGERSYDGLGSKFPLGYWKQGEVRTYPSKRPTRIEIIELDGPDHCLTFRWTVAQGKKRNQDNNYTFCPDIGLTKITSNYRSKDSKK